MRPPFRQTQNGIDDLFCASTACHTGHGCGGRDQKFTESSHGNWLTHGSQIESETATACVRAALNAGITGFETAEIYANTKAEEVLGAALKGARQRSLEVFTKASSHC